MGVRSFINYHRHSDALRSENAQSYIPTWSWTLQKYVDGIHPKGFGLINGVFHSDGRSIRVDLRNRKSGFTSSRPTDSIAFFVSDTDQGTIKSCSTYIRPLEILRTAFSEWFFLFA